MLRVGAFFIVLLLLTSETRAQDGCQSTQQGTALCSRTFQAVARCGDPEALAAIAGNDCPSGQSCSRCPSGKDCPLIEPWEAVPIRIHGIEIAASGPIAGAFAGNNHMPDVMADMGAGLTHRAQWFPEGLAFSMPARGTPGAHHIDLHVLCARTSKPTWWPAFLWKSRPIPAYLRYTIYYSLAPEPIDTPVATAGR